MPGYNTLVRENLKTYLEKLVDQQTVDSRVTANYLAMLSALDQLNETTDELYKADENGNRKPYEREDHEKLLREYEASIRAAKELLTASEPKRGEPQSADLMELRGLTQQVLELMQKDVTTLTGVKMDEKGLASAIDSSRARRVDVTDKKFSTVGDKGNVRKAMTLTDESGREYKGFFTQEKKTGYSPEKLTALQKTAQAFKNDYPLVATELDEAIEHIYNEKNFSADAIPQALANILNSQNKQSAEYQRVLDEISNVAFDGEYPALEDAFGQLYNENMQYDATILAESGSSITGRNVAMSKVANLLEMPQIIAHSENLELVDEKGNVTRGVFMANAMGVDRKKIMPEDVAHCDEKSGDNPALLKSIAQLQILDYICGNVDRHQDNFFYQFNEDHSKLIGIQGIDNDFSFGTMIPREDEQLTDAETPLADIKVAPKALADRLKVMDGAMLRFALQGTGITDREIAAAERRLTNVKNALTQGKIREVTDEQWKEQKLEDLAKEAKTHSLFKMVNKQVKQLQNTAESNLQAKQEEAPGKKPLRFEKVNLLEGFSRSSLEKDASDFGKFASRMEASQKSIWGRGSGQFRNMKEAVETYQKTLQNMPENPQPEDYLRLQIALDKVHNRAQEYLQSKEGKGLNANGKIRLELAKDIRNYAEKRRDDLRDALERQNERETEEILRETASDKAKAAQLEAKDQSLDKCLQMEEKLRNDDSHASAFLSVAVKNSFERVGDAIFSGSISPRNTEQVKKSLATLVVYDRLVTEREFRKRNNQEGPGPLENSLIADAKNTVVYDFKAVKKVMENPTFQKLTENLSAKSLQDMVLNNKAHDFSLQMKREFIKESAQQLKNNEPQLQQNVPQVQMNNPQ